MLAVPPIMVQEVTLTPQNVLLAAAEMVQEVTTQATAPALLEGYLVELLTVITHTAFKALM